MLTAPRMYIAVSTAIAMQAISATTPTALIAQDAVAPAPPSAPATPAVRTSHPLNLAFTVHASTLGFGGELSKLVGGHFAVRVGANVANYSRTQTLSGVAYDARLSFRNYTALVDLFPSYEGSFHLTGGIVGSTNVIGATGVPAADGSIKLDGTNYTRAEVGVLTGKLAFPSTGWYAGTGWGSPVRRGSRVRLILDWGAVIGAPTLDIHASNESSNAQLAASVAAQRDKTQSDINKYVKVWPVISLGLSTHF